MKRLVFCFDGTWNRLSADTPTNVVLTAASIVREAHDATQIIHYDEGVGTGRLEKWSGGVLGVGLVEIVRKAYGFLIFNYDPGDEIFVFGFSRGACSARTFIGLIHHVGILRRLHAARIDEAIQLYQRRLLDADGSGERMCRFRSGYSDNVCIGPVDDAWRCKNVDGYVSGHAPTISIKYLGLWDTVCALGVPAMVPFSTVLNRKHSFHDLALTGFVEQARHAIAIDERRALFPCMPWGDLSELNRAKGFAPDDLDAPYQEKWFPGGHGSVGGGGDLRGLSDGALAWITRGAKNAGMVLDRDAGSRIHGFHPDPLTSLENTSVPDHGATYWILADRSGPDREGQVSMSAIRRWHAPAELLPEHQPYRPKTLSEVTAQLDAIELPRAWSGEVLAEHVVVFGDGLRALAKQYYGDPNLSDVIFQANRDFLDDPDELFEGQKLCIPTLPNSAVMETASGAQPAERTSSVLAASPLARATLVTDAIPPEAQESEIQVRQGLFYGPDGQNFGKIKEPGLVNYGTTSIDQFVAENPHDFAGVPPSLLRVVRAVSANEGKLEAINTWDNSFLSFGAFQWTAGAGNEKGELAGFLDRLKTANPELFQKYFAAYGLNIEMDPPAQGQLRKGYMVLNTRRLDTPDSKDVLRRPIWAYRFWRAAHDPGVRRSQVNHSMERVDLFYKVPQPTLEGKLISDFVNSEYGVALLLDEHVNRPGHVPPTLVAALKTFNDQTGKGNPAGWTTADEGALLKLYLQARAGTNMTDSQKRADAIHDAVGDGRLSVERGSFVGAQLDRSA